MNTLFTKRQGQYLAFIYYYTKIHHRAPAEADIQVHFKVSAPTVHQMVLTLDRRGFIERVPGQARSIRVLVATSELPDLE
ncbi:MAG: MarR family transcriptional regulator [Acidobacteria bacterium]|nr:MarR family transcriptional regulator [Acidobacteriota bacterium]MBI3656868.1 MarR family transcriptional regulator [Acidobacteriota bacterium]